MTKKNGNTRLPLIIMAVALIAAAAVIFWQAAHVLELEEHLMEANAALSSRQEALNASEAAAADLQAELTFCQGALADAQADLTLAREAHDGTQAALLAVTEEKAEADAQIADLTAARDSLEEQLQQLATDKEMADAALAALGYGRIEAPAVTEEPAEEVPAEEPAADEPEAVPEEPAVEETEVIPEEPAADEAAEEVSAEEPEIVTEEPAAEEELFGEEPAVEPMMYNVYTADALGLAFEAPVNWLVEDFETGRYSLVDPENPDGCHSTLNIRSYPADGAALADVLADLILTDEETMSGTVTTGEIIARDLLGEYGLYVDSVYQTQEGPVYCSRLHVIIMDDTVYAVSVTTTQARFEALVTDVYEHFCATVRLIP